jgi:Fe-S cluster assembly protein SufD
MADMVKEKEKSYLKELLANISINGRNPDFVKAEQEKALNQVSEISFPTPRTEDWRQISLKSLTKKSFRPAEASQLTESDLSEFYLKESAKSRLVLSNGYLRSELSDVSGLPEGVFAGKLSELPEALRERAEAGFNKVARYENDPFTPFNTASFADVVVVYVSKDVQTGVPLQIIHATKGDVFTAPRTLIIAERHSEMTIVEDFVGVGSDAYFNTAVTETVLDDESHVTHLKLQRESKNAIHISRTAALLGRGSNYNSYTISIGALLFRNEPLALVDAENAHATLDGLVLITGEQVSDTHSIMDHLKPNCTSHQLHKVIAHGNARSVFNGKIFVRQDSQLIDAFQENRNLLLSPEATVFTKPQLEIFADDVKCSHGATIGQLSEDELFYLMSRGLSHAEAMQMLTYGFALAVIDNLPIESLREQLSREVKQMTTEFAFTTDEA